MGVIRKLGDRVEKEHNQFLRDSQRIEDRSGVGEAGAFTGAPGVGGGGVDFESLVGRANGATVKADSAIESKSWDDDDPWGSILAAAPPTEVRAIRSVVWPISRANRLTNRHRLLKSCLRRPRHSLECNLCLRRRRLSMPPRRLGSVLEQHRLRHSAHRHSRRRLLLLTQSP